MFKEWAGCAGSESCRLRGLGHVRRKGRRFPQSYVSFMILDPLLVPAELLLDLVNTQVHRRFRGRPLFAGEEIMFMLGRDADLHLPGVFDVIDGDLDRHQPTEVFEQFLSFVAEVALLLQPQTAMAGRYLDLHPSAPCLVTPPARN